jgi:hypothetical protein
MERDLKLSLEPELKPLARMRASLLPMLGDNKKQVREAWEERWNTEERRVKMSIY